MNPECGDEKIVHTLNYFSILRYLATTSIGNLEATVLLYEKPEKKFQ